MAVVFFKEIHRGRGGQTAFSTEYYSEAKFTRVFLVRTDNNFDDKHVIEQYILSHRGTCPWIGDTHPNDQTAKVERIEFRNVDESKIIWIVTYEYGLALIQDDPTFDDPIIRWSTEYRQKAAATHWLPQGTGTLPWQEVLILNSAGDPFDPPPTIDDTRWMVHVQKNVKSMLEVEPLLDYKDAVNRDAVIIDMIQFGAGELKVMEMSVSEWNTRGAFSYRILSVTLAIDKLNDWNLCLLNVGLRQIDPQDPTQRKYCTLNGEAGAPVSAPVLLHRTTGFQIVNPSADDIADCKLAFDVYNRLKFGGTIPGCISAD